MNRMKRNYQRLKFSALPSVPAKLFFACWMLSLAIPSVSFGQELVSKHPVLVPGSLTQHNTSDHLSKMFPTVALLEAKLQLSLAAIACQSYIGFCGSNLNDAKSTIN